MKVSINWLKELVDLKVPIEEAIRHLPLRTIGLKEVTGKFFELDMKGYNRADLLSIRGVAREVAAITDSRINFSDLENTDNNLSHVRKNVSKISVDVRNPELATVYCIAKIEGLKVKPSSNEWTSKLEDSGVRSINNVADVTNLIMLEYGQPMHAFDTEKVNGETIIVRLSLKGDALQTLDGKNRKLSGDDLLITDPEKVLGIAGVMGGKDSEISESTTTILLEAAIFDPVSIRKTSQRHGLSSEASKRFQHGLTKTNLLHALNAAIKMYEGLGGRLTGLTTVGDFEDKVKKITLTQKKINSLIGINIPAEEVEKHLQSLGFKSSRIRSNNNYSSNTFTTFSVNSVRSNYEWEVTVPYWRLDINIEEDLIEEIARMYGYEKIPSQELQSEQPKKVDQSLFEKIYSTKKTLAEAGLTEVQTYSFYSTNVIESLELLASRSGKIENLVKIANPISSETEYLRDKIWPNLVEVVEKNIKQGYKDIAIFEIGKVYYTQKDSAPKESYKLAIALMNGGDNPIEELVNLTKEHLRGENISYTPGVSSRITSVVHTGSERNVGGETNTLFHPTRFASVKSNDKPVGYLAEVHPRILNTFGIEKRVAILEINIDDLN